MRVFLRWLSVFSALVMIISPATIALAQQVPVRVVQGTDGTMYILQGGKSWTLVPDQLSDSDVAQLSPTGEIDGLLPNELFVVQAPAPPPPAAPAPPPAAQQPAQPAAPAGPAPITGTADLTGKAGTDVASATLIAIGATISSTVAANTRPKEVFSIELSAGATYQLRPSSPNKYGAAGAWMVFHILNPDGTQAAQWQLGGGGGVTGCYPTLCMFTPAASGTYFLQFDAASTLGQQYVFSFK